MILVSSMSVLCWLARNCCG